MARAGRRVPPSEEGTDIGRAHVGVGSPLAAAGPESFSHTVAVVRRPGRILLGHGSSVMSGSSLALLKLWFPHLNDTETNSYLPWVLGSSMDRCQGPGLHK